MRTPARASRRLRTGAWRPPRSLFSRQPGRPRAEHACSPARASEVGRRACAQRRRPPRAGAGLPSRSSSPRRSDRRTGTLREGSSRLRSRPTGCSCTARRESTLDWPGRCGGTPGRSGGPLRSPLVRAARRHALATSARHRRRSRRRWAKRKGGGAGGAGVVWARSVQVRSHSGLGGIEAVHLPLRVPVVLLLAEAVATRTEVATQVELDR